MTAIGAACFLTNRPRSGARKHVTQHWRLPDKPGHIPTMDELRRYYASRESRKAVELTFGTRGLPALAAPVKPLRQRKPIEQMTAQEIADTVNDELPTISHEVNEELGTKALSLDAGASFDDETLGTLAEAIPNDHWLRDAFAEVFERFASGDKAAKQELRDLYDLWLGDEHAASRYGTRVSNEMTLDPAVRNRIEWERFAAQCSDISRHEGFRVRNNRVEFFSFPATDRATFLARKAAHVREYLAERGLTEFPTFAQFMTERAQRRAARRNRRAITTAMQVHASLDALDMTRRAWTDDDAGTSREEVDYDYVPSLALITYQVMKANAPKERLPYDQYVAHRTKMRKIAFERWLRLNQEAEERLAERRDDGTHLVHRCRNSRCHGSNDEMWRATMAEEDVDAPVVALGMVGL